MSHRAFKDRLYAEFATIGKALASAHRLELLDLLGQGERSVDELAQEIGQSLANTSAHLQVLRQARLVEADKRGLNVVYRLAAPEVFTLWSTLREAIRSELQSSDPVYHHARQRCCHEKSCIKVAPICSSAQSTWSLVITSGGAMRIVWSWVSLARMPLPCRASQ